MNDDFERELTRLFAKASVALPSDQFTTTLFKQLRRVERRQQWFRITVGVLSLGVLAASTPALLRASVTIAQHLGDAVSPFGQLLVSPAAWTLSLLVGLVVLRRARHLLR